MSRPIKAILGLGVTALTLTACASTSVAYLPNPTLPPSSPSTVLDTKTPTGPSDPAQTPPVGPVPTSSKAPSAPSIQVSGPLTASLVGAAWRPGCPVGPAALRKVTFNYYTPKGAVSRGTWVVAAKAVPGIKLLVNTMWDSRFPLFKVAESSDYYKGGTGNDADKRLMNGNISSGFNCRTVTGTTSWSNHAYGLAVDINPLWNPYVTKQGVQPPASKPWVKNRKGTGVLEAKGTIVKKMTAAGWTWGGYWSNPDYQHLELK